MNGDASVARREFETPPSLNGRIGQIESSVWYTTSAPTKTSMQSYDIAAKQFSGVLAELKSIDADIKKIEATLEQNKVPYTPGRIPVWNDK